jgi:hypothetical protein
MKEIAMDVKQNLPGVGAGVVGLCVALHWQRQEAIVLIGPMRDDAWA